MLVPTDIPLFYHDVFHLHFVVQDMDNLRHGILNVEQAYVLCEVRPVLLEDGVVQDVMNEEVNELSG